MGCVVSCLAGGERLEEEEEEEGEEEDKGWRDTCGSCCTLPKASALHT